MAETNFLLGHRRKDRKLEILEPQLLYISMRAAIDAAAATGKDDIVILEVHYSSPPITIERTLFPDIY